jgi:hypothetical protein
MVFNFHLSCVLSQWWGQALLDMVKHQVFEPEFFQSTTIIHLLLQLELPFKETLTTTYNFCMPEDENQILKLVICYDLDVFREIMHDPRWKGGKQGFSTLLFANL